MTAGVQRKILTYLVVDNYVQYIHTYIHTFIDSYIHAYIQE